MRLKKATYAVIGKKFNISASRVNQITGKTGSVQEPGQATCISVHLGREVGRKLLFLARSSKKSITELIKPTVLDLIEKKLAALTYTSRGYVDAFMVNQNNKDEWTVDYPDGISVKDICENDSVDVMLYSTIFFEETGEIDVTDCDLPGGYEIEDCGDRYTVTDVENYGTKYYKNIGKGNLDEKI